MSLTILLALLALYLGGCVVAWFIGYGDGLQEAQDEREGQ